ncbi:Imm6 family immunity protein [Paenibacillus sp. SAF-054]|uniref:Imm6 family immunity protein n=1 Tax=unclassified Paenibacillus TaxID=185978 RepID=UPI003F7E4428
MKSVEEMTVNSRVAICLAYVERTLDYLEGEFRDGTYDQAFGKFRMILRLGHEWLTGSHVDWDEIYRMCNDDEEEYGCFDFIANAEVTERYEAASIMLIWGIYYFMYQCAHRSNERYFPQDLWDGSLPEDEEIKMIDSLHHDAAEYLSPEVCDELRRFEIKHRG